MVKSGIMNAKVISVALTMVSCCALAGDPVAEGFPAWTGVEKANYIAGRELTPSDLRHKTVVVVEFEEGKATEQLGALGLLARKLGIDAMKFGGAHVFETMDLPREMMVVYVCRDVKDRAALQDLLAKPAPKNTSGGFNMMRVNRAPVYQNVTFPGAPDNGGKLPFVYVMGPTGLKPSYAGTPDMKLDANKLNAEMVKVIGKAPVKVEWRSFYGTESDAKGFPRLEAALAKGKPMKAAEAELVKGIQSKDPEVARKAQVLFDALRQKRGDLIVQVDIESQFAPHCAAENLALLLRHWPDAKKSVAAADARLKANTAAAPLIRIYPEIKKLSDPNFVCKPSEKKKLTQKLQKYRKQLEALKEDKNVNVQNGAFRLQSMVEEALPKFEG